MNINNFSEVKNELFWVDMEAKAKSLLPGKRWAVGYSGGADSDTVMWALRLMGFEPRGVFYNTGIEYVATMRHIEYMRSEGFIIDEIKGLPVPVSTVKNGQPFISKFVSYNLSRLQNCGFDFKNQGELDFETLYALYPNMKSTLRWWTNNHAPQFNIQRNKLLKEFLIENDGLPFKASTKCCDDSKKKPVKLYAKENNLDLMVIGIRKSEGGARNTYRSCHVGITSRYKYEMYFPMFWWTNDEKKYFDSTMQIKHSDCYTTYGMVRTGCAGCPLGRNMEDSIKEIQPYEPKLYNAVTKMFAQSYEWTRKYREFVEDNK